eukprot:Skav229966  [mRNA]  locus=scaffold327:352924:356745:- [translate_table: standard]
MASEDTPNRAVHLELSHAALPPGFSCLGVGHCRKQSARERKASAVGCVGRDLGQQGSDAPALPLVAEHPKIKATLASQHHCQLLRCPPPPADAKLQRLEGQNQQFQHKLQQMDLQQALARESLKQRLHVSVGIFLRQEEDLVQKCACAALRAWHQMVASQQRRMKFVSAVRPVPRDALGVGTALGMAVKLCLEHEFESEGVPLRC